MSSRYNTMTLVVLLPCPAPLLENLQYQANLCMVGCYCLHLLKGPCYLLQSCEGIFSYEGILCTTRLSVSLFLLLHAFPCSYLKIAIVTDHQLSIRFIILAVGSHQCQVVHTPGQFWVEYCVRVGWRFQPTASTCQEPLSHAEAQNGFPRLQH